MRIFVSDIESNGLWDTVDKFHCAFVHEYGTDNWWGFRPHQLKEYLDKLEEADVVVFHNGIDYDLPVLSDKFGVQFRSPPVFDTIVLSRMLDPDRPAGHSLDSWGEELGEHKGTYGKQENAWERFTEEMFKYCEQDVRVTTKLYERLCHDAGFDPTNPPNSSIIFT